MDTFVIEGGTPLKGRLTVNGAKNAALPEMAAALLTDEPLTLCGLPEVADVRNMRRLLAELGCEIEDTDSTATEDTPPQTNLRMHTTDPNASHARYEVVRTMRAGICVLGPLLGRRGYARVSMPGGCAIGDRPIDIHLRGLKALGARFSLEAGDLVARAPAGGRLIGARVFLGGPFGSTVLGTANVMCAAALAKGTTIIESAACEPEVADLAALLNQMGAKISGAGAPRITIEGVDSLSGATHTVLPDRIEAGTFMLAAAITGGRLTIDNCPLDTLMALTDLLERTGVSVVADQSSDLMRATCEVFREPNTPLSPAHFTTQPHPGFPTDLQAQTMALLCLADGNSVVTEKIFPQRFLHVPELSRMGAQLVREGSTVVVNGVDRLTGAPIMASDLRASACLVLAGLAAQGTTIIHRVYHLDRGYANLETRLQRVGARIKRVQEDETKTSATLAAAGLAASL